MRRPFELLWFYSKTTNMESTVVPARVSSTEVSGMSGYPYFLTADKVKQISAELDKYVRENKPFLRVGYSIRDLGADIGIPSYLLSAYINQWLGMNFNEYFNRFRVQYCQELMESGRSEQFNLRGLALCCGFNNRNTFTTAFKKFTGYTPSSYCRRRVAA
jgi:AraC-like DNA-binding protein